MSEDHFDVAIILRDPANVIVLLMGKEGLVCRAARIPPNVVPSLLEAIAGPRAGLPLVLVQDIHHHVGQSAAVDRFYSTWFKPDDPNKSCCNTVDCYPTQAEIKDGQWWAKRRGDDKYIPIPWAKVETNRNNPDGRSHLCEPGPTPSHPPNTVFCFIPGSGT